jgi:hypothetical protein
MFFGLVSFLRKRNDNDIARLWLRAVDVRACPDGVERDELLGRKAKARRKPD